jgi:hypothetical protein
MAGEIAAGAGIKSLLVLFFRKERFLSCRH